MAMLKYSVFFVLIVGALFISYSQLPQSRQQLDFQRARQEALLQVPTLTEGELERNADYTTQIDAHRVEDDVYQFTVTIRIFENGRYVRARSEVVVIDKAVSEVNVPLLVSVWITPPAWWGLMFMLTKNKSSI